MSHDTYYQIDANGIVIASVRTNGAPITDINSMKINQEGICLGMLYTVIDDTFRHLVDGMPVEENKVVVSR